MRRLRDARLIIAIIALTLALFAAITAYRVYAEASHAKAELARAERKLRATDVDGARRELSEADTAFAHAHELLRSPILRAFGVVPLAHRQIATADALASAGRSLVRAGTSAVSAASAATESHGLSGGRVDFDVFARPAARLRDVLAPLSSARQTLKRSSSTWLVSPLARQRADALRRVSATETTTRRALAGMEAAPELLGRGGIKRYFVAFDTPAELRATGGVIGFYAVLAAKNGRLTLESTGRPENFISERLRGPSVPAWFSAAYGRYGALSDWGSLNLSSDFPAIARMMIAATTRSLGRLDGVVQLDAKALSVFLGLTGPVSVRTWPTPLTANNVERIMQNEAYVRFATNNARRIALLGDVVRAVFSRLLGARVTLDGASLSSLGSAASGGHVQLYSTKASSERALASAGIARDLARTKDATDVLAVVGNNFDSNKIDWFLSRTISYDVTLDPDTNRAQGSVRVGLRNDAPASGLPPYVIGSVAAGGSVGANRDLVVMLRTPSDDPLAVTEDGKRILVSRDPEAGLVGYHHVVKVPPKGSVSMRATLQTRDALVGRGRDRTYRLVVLGQPTVRADHLSVRIRAPSGWSIEGPTSFSGPLTGDRVFEIHLHRRTVSWLVDAAVVRPFRAFLDLF